MHRIKIYYLADKEKDITACILISSKDENTAYGRLYKIREMLDKENKRYIVYCKKGIFSRYKRFFTINDLGD